MPFEYEDLMEVISFDGFSFTEWFLHEPTILEPRLRELGYTEIKFFHGERDSFGPLTRKCNAKDKNGRWHHFIYG